MAATPVRWLDEIDGRQVSVAGGKGASLGELVHAGVPVPPAFVVTSGAFKSFLAAADPDGAVPGIVRILDAGAIEAADAAARIAARLEGAPVSAAVAAAVREAVDLLGASRLSVRSSATCEDGDASAWAGQLETFLDVAPDDVIENVRRCWLSIFGESALAYGAAHGYGAGEFAVAVVVQEMVASEVSGIGFSVHPVTQEPGVMLIEACVGLGEAIVSGRIAPDQFVVEKGSREITARSVGRQKEGLFVGESVAGARWRTLGEAGAAVKLSDAQVLEYADQLARIEAHYGFPVDTEWALEQGRFRVLQARPITTLAKEYREDVVDPATAWQPLIRRPMTLMEVSIWYHWIDSKHANGALGVTADRALAIQDDADISNQFLTAEVVERSISHLGELMRQDPAHLLEILRRGKDVYRDVRARFERSPRPDLEEACELFVEALQYTGAIPFLALAAADEAGIDAPEIVGLAEELRSETIYPVVMRRAVDPAVADLMKEVGFSAPEQGGRVCTWSELREGRLDRETLEERWRAVERGERFVFQALPEGERVRFVSQTGYLLMRLTGRRELPDTGRDDVLHGQAAWPGIHRGRARVVVAPDAVGQTIEDGEVLVSIQSSPALMPLLRRCGAIVTDEGGVACHAAIICRELEIPTVIGTERATQVIRTGDLVEVDAYAQEVRILERA